MPDDELDNDAAAHEAFLTGTAYVAPSFKTQDQQVQDRKYIIALLELLVELTAANGGFNYRKKLIKAKNDVYGVGEQPSTEVLEQVFKEL